LLKLIDPITPLPTLRALHLLKTRQSQIPDSAPGLVLFLAAEPRLRIFHYMQYNTRNKYELLQMDPRDLCVG